MNYVFLCEFEELWAPVRDAASQGGGVHGNAILSRWDMSNTRVVHHTCGTNMVYEARFPHAKATVCIASRAHGDAFGKTPMRFAQHKCDPQPMPDAEVSELLKGC